MIPLLCASLLAIAWLTREPSADSQARRNLRRMRKERLDLNPALRRMR